MSRRVHRHPPGQVGPIANRASTSPGSPGVRGSRGPAVVRADGVRPGPAHYEHQPNDRVKMAAVCLLLAGATLVVFWPVARFDFINLDDPGYFSANPHVLGGLRWDNVLWAFGTRYMGNWHPLTWVSLMMDVTLFGRGPVSPHLVNLFFHIVNAVLLLVLLRRMTGALWRSALIAALFALHPLRVESVAWVAERKDVLSGLFFLVTLWVYVRYVEFRRAGEGSKMPNAESRTPKDAPRFTFHASVYYALALFFFTLGLMSKPMLVTLPFVLLLLDYWPLRRFQPGTRNAGRRNLPGLLLEKVPFFLLSGVFCVVTFMVQRQSGAMVNGVELPLASRAANALVAYCWYLGKTVWPVDLAVFYPRPLHWPWFSIAAAGVFVVALGLAAVWYGRRRPYVATGWLWFFGMLLPVVGLVQVGGQAMADRYTYLPAIGLFLIVVWGMAEWARAWHLPKAVIGLGVAAVLTICGLRTADQLRHWQGSETLFRHALACTSGNYVAHNSLGVALAAQRKWDAAIQQYSMALQAAPGFAAAHINLAEALLAQGKPQEAIEECQRALAIRPDLAEAHNNLGLALAALGRWNEAIQHYEAAVGSDPSNVAGYVNWANALLARGKWEEASRRCELALKVDPDLPEAHNALAQALAAHGRWDEALAHFERALHTGRHLAEIHGNLGVAFAAQEKWKEAMQEYELALQIKPGLTSARVHLADALLAQGKPKEAIPHYKRALKTDSDLADVHDRLGLALARTGQWAEAIAHYERALALQPGALSPRNNLAWLLATCPQAEFRNGPKAVELAQELNRLAGGNIRDALDTLAAAYAEAGQFPQAVEAAQRAVALAVAQTNSQLEHFRARLKLYQAGFPHHEPPVAANDAPHS